MDSDEDTNTRETARDKFRKERVNYQRGYQDQDSHSQCKRLKRDDGIVQKSSADSVLSGTGKVQDTETLTQPPVLTFKSFLADQKDDISDEEALTKYKEYKLNFMKQQILEFFIKRKDEEWFMRKYHPGDYEKYTQKIENVVKCRSDAFMKLFDLGWLDNISVNIVCAKELTRFLDAVVILLEGGDMNDLLICLNLDDDKGTAKVLQPQIQETDNAVAGNFNRKGGVFAQADITSKESNQNDTKKGEDMQKMQTRDGDRHKSVDNICNSDTTYTAKDINRGKSYHQVQSIYIQNLPKNTSLQSIEDLCKNYDGFLRVFLQDPLPEKKFLRQCWITFDSTVNIKDICWKISNLKLNDCEIRATINTELKNRIRVVSGLAEHCQIVNSDVKLALQILEAFWGIWKDPNREQIFNMNPIFIGLGKCLEKGDINSQIDAVKGKDWSSDKDMRKCLDLMILYLRVVYSFDFYAALTYSFEDEMPHRCGILHVRGNQPAEICERDLHNWSVLFNKKISKLHSMRNILSDDECKKLGLKNPDTEVDIFIKANTQELAKDKWLCPLTGKKI